MDKDLIFRYVMMGLVLALSVGCAQLPRIVELHDPLSAEEHFQLALAYERKKENELALKEYEEVLRKKAFRGECYTNMANIYYSQGKPELSETYYLKSIHADPLYGKAYNNLAWLLMSQNKQLDQAEQLLLKAIEKDPEHSASYLDTLGTVYEKEGRWDRSLEVLKKAEKAGFKGDPALETQFLKHLEKVLAVLENKEVPLHGH